LATFHLFSATFDYQKINAENKAYFRWPKKATENKRFLIFGGKKTVKNIFYYFWHFCHQNNKTLFLMLYFIIFNDFFLPPKIIKIYHKISQ
jgi:hypothetical protein